jgi:hypothetical protein
MSSTRCIGGDASCPCNDGDACHYKDTPRTKAWPIPEHRCFEHIVVRRGTPRYKCGRCGWPIRLALKPNEVLMRVSP